MPSSWRKDPRFQCPVCKQLIQLKLVSSRNAERAGLDIVAVCDSCRRVYTVRDWRRRLTPHDPWDDMDF